VGERLRDREKNKSLHMNKIKLTKNPSINYLNKSADAHVVRIERQRAQISGGWAGGG